MAGVAQTVAFALSFLVIPVNEPIEDECDTVEIHHMYDGEGRKLWTQLICWDVHRDGNEHVRWWKMRPAFQVLVGEGVTLRMVTEELGGIVVRGRAYRERHLQVDPEILDRDMLPQCQRRGLRSCYR